MDLLSDVLTLLAARSRVATGLRTGGDWALQVKGFTGLKFVALHKGTARFRLCSEAVWITLNEGDAFILTQGEDFLLASDERFSASAMTLPPDAGGGLVQHGHGGDVIFLAGKMTLDVSASDLLIDTMPPVIHLPSGTAAATTMQWLLQKLLHEISAGLPGGEIVQDHLLHLMIVEGLRSWLASSEPADLGWLGALKDPRLSRVLGAIHADPFRAWRLPEFASIAGMSRASFASHFRNVVGTSAFDYLTRWKMRIAVGLLRQGNEPIVVIADRLGYGSDSAFSTAFKRVYGVPPVRSRQQKP